MMGDCVIDVTSLMSGTVSCFAQRSVPDAVLPAVEKLTVPRDCLQPPHPDTVAHQHFLCRIVSYRRRVIASSHPSCCRYTARLRLGSSVDYFSEMSPMKENSLRTVRLRMRRRSGRLFVVTARSLRAQHVYVGEGSGRLFNGLTLT